MTDKERRISRRTFIPGAAAITVSAVLAAKRGDVGGALAAFLPRLEAPQNNDINLFTFAFDLRDPFSVKILAIARPISKPTFSPRTYVVSYSDGAFGEWRAIDGETFTGLTMEAMAVSPANSNIQLIGGKEVNSPNQGVAMLTRDNGRSLQRLSIEGLGPVKSTVFSKDGGRIYLDAGIVIKIDAGTGNRIDISNSGLPGIVEGTLRSSPTQNETLYAVNSSTSLPMYTQDGGQNWVIRFNPPNYLRSELLQVVNWQGNDTVIAGGENWLRIQIGNQWPIEDYSQNFSTLAVDNTGSQLKFFGVRVADNGIRVKFLNESSWRVFSSNGLPANRTINKLRFINISDPIPPGSDNWLIAEINNSGLWGYRLRQGEAGTWQLISGLARLHTNFIPSALKGAPNP